MTEKLKPCPLCKGTNLKLYATLAAGYGSRRGVIKCPCGLELRVIAKRELADLPAELAPWPHVRLSDIGRGPLGRHAGRRDPGYLHDRNIEYAAMRRLRQRLADDVAAVAMLKATASP